MTIDEALAARPTATDAELAAELDCHPRTVHRARIRLGLPPPPSSPPLDAPTPEQLSAARDALLSGASLRQAEAQTGVSAWRLRAIRTAIRAELGEGAAQPRLRGRPRSRIALAVSADEVADLERQAADEGVTVEELVRRRALEVVPG